MNAIRLMSALATACGLVMLATAAHAGTQVSGKVQTILSAAGAGGAPGNADLRVQLDGVTTFCPGVTDGSWAFINSNDANFKGILAAITTAYAMGKTLTVYTVPGAVGASTFCQIAWVQVSG